MGLLRFSWRQVRRTAAIWSAVLAIVIASGASTYHSAYADPMARRLFAESVAKLPALQALYGRAVGVDTAGGFLAWRYGGMVTVAVALWALLTVTRLLRGDEEALRAEVLVASPVSPRRIMVHQLAAVALGCALIWAVIVVVSVASDLPAGGAVLFGLMVASGGLVFGAIGAFTSQLFSTRRRASGWAGAILGASYLVRAVGDGSTHLRWLGWASPLGWIERIEPFTGADLIPLVLVATTTVALVTGAVVLREHRDTGGGLIDERSGGGEARPVRSVLALTWQLSRGALIAWTVGVAVGMFVLGYLTNDVVVFTQDNAAIDDMVRKMFGFSMSEPAGYLGLAFTVAAMVLGVYVGSHLVVARDEEGAGRADNLLVAQVSRARWLLTRVGFAVGATLGLALATGVGTWLGVLASGAHISLWDSLRGTFNVVPAALFFGGLAVATFGLAPRVTSYVAYGSVALGYLVQVVAGLASAPAWLMDLSPFWHISPVPARPPNGGALIAFVVLAVALTALGTLAFSRRDVVSD